MSSFYPIRPRWLLKSSSSEYKGRQEHAPVDFVIKNISMDWFACNIPSEYGSQI